MIGLCVTLLVLFGLSAFLAASEMAFISVHPVRLREQADNQNRHAQAVLKLSGESQRFLCTVLIAINMTHVTATAVMSYLLETQFSIHSEMIVTAIMTPILLIFCEMLPKEYARLHALGFLTSREPWLTLLYRLLYWPAQAFMRLTEMIFPDFLKKDEKIFINEVEFKALVAESEKKGVLDSHELDFVHTILDFERIAVSSVMVPLNKVAVLELRGDVADARELAREKGDRVILVYDEDPSIVAGVIYVFDVLAKERENGPLMEFLKSPLFIPETMPLEEAFRILQRKRQSFALVTDAHYEVTGVVPIENLLLGQQL